MSDLDPTPDPNYPGEVPDKTKKRIPIRGNQGNPPESPPHYPPQGSPPSSPNMANYRDEEFKQLPIFSGDLTKSTARGHVLAFRDYCDMHNFTSPAVKYTKFRYSLKGKAREWFENNKHRDGTAATEAEYEDLLKRFARRYGTTGSSAVNKHLIWANLALKEGEDLDDFLDRMGALQDELGKTEMDACIQFRNALPANVGRFLYIDDNTKLSDLAERAKQYTGQLNMMQSPTMSMDMNKAMPATYAQASASSSAEKEMAAKIEQLESKLRSIEKQESSSIKESPPEAASSLTARDIEDVLRRQREADNLSQLTTNSRVMEDTMRQISQRLDAYNMYGLLSLQGDKTGQTQTRGPQNHGPHGQAPSGQNSRPYTSTRTKSRITMEQVIEALKDDNKPCPIHGDRGKNPHNARMCKTIAAIIAGSYDPEYKPPNGRFPRPNKQSN